MKNEKKTFFCAMLLVVGMLISLTACGNSGSSSSADISGTQSQNQASKATDFQPSNEPVQKDDGLVHIRTSADMLDFAERVNGGEVTLNAVLENDIDMSEVCGVSVGSFAPINNFAGEFDGGGHAILNLYCVQEKGTATLFDTLEGTVKNHLD